MKFNTLLLLLAFLLTACSQPDQPTVGLYVAIKRGDLDQIERHIYWKTDINQNNVDGNSPLHESARAGRTVISEVLLDHGAMVNKLNRNNKTPLQLALENGRTQIAKMLIDKYRADFEPTLSLFDSVIAGVSDRDVFHFLANRNADFNAINDAGFSPLALAIAERNRVQAKHLIQYGADVNLAISNGKTPLDLARDNRDTDIEQLLLANGAGTN